MEENKYRMNYFVSCPKIPQRLKMAEIYLLTIGCLLFTATDLRALRDSAANTIDVTFLLNFSNPHGFQ